MKTIKTVLITGLIVLAPFAAKAEEVMLAWQTPGYVVDEIVTIATRPTSLPADVKQPVARPEIPESCM